MKQNLEIEFKTLLSKENYLKLLNHFEFEEYVTQENFYFDTPDFKLKEKNYGLRTRILNNTGEITLKTPKGPHQLIETNYYLNTKKTKEFLKKQNLIYSPKIATLLKNINVDYNDLQYFAKLKTERFIKKLSPKATIMLDKSLSYGYFDYELEIEFSSSENAEKLFYEFLNTFSLPYIKADNKITRAIKNKHKKNN